MTNSLKDLLYTHFDKHMDKIIKCDETKCNEDDCRKCYLKLIEESRGN